MWSVVLNCFLVVLFSNLVFINGNCTYTIHKNKISPPGHERLNGLINQRYEVSDIDYNYYVGICTSAKIGAPTEAGVLQVSNDPKGKSFVIGRLNASSIKAGRNWVLLDYADGDHYGSHCGHEKRRAAIMFTCDEQLTTIANVRLLEENTEKVQDCYYLFEIAHSSICNAKKTLISALSIGSIIVITFFIVVTLYIIIGFLIQRCRGAKGMDQIPNYGLWQDCGNLVADGCDYVFRSRPKVTNHLYPPMQGQPRQTLHPDDRHLIDDDDNDDHMLPM